MIDAKLKEMILNKLKFVNNGNLDYLNMDDITMEVLTYSRIDQIHPFSKKYGGPYAAAACWGPRDRAYEQCSRYFLITVKPGRPIRGRMVVDVVYYHRSAHVIDTSDKYLCNLSATTEIPSIRDSGLRGALVYESTFLDGNTVSQMTKEDIVKKLLKDCYNYLDISDLSYYNISTTNVKSDNNIYTNNHILKLNVNTLTFGIKSGVKYPYQFVDNMVYIADSRYKINIRKYYYNGNTDGLTLSLADGDVSFAGCDPNKEGSLYSTLSMMSDELDEPKFMDLLNRMVRHTVISNGKKLPIEVAGVAGQRAYKLDKLSNDDQNTIIDYMSRNHHWKWGTQNKAGNYSDQPSSHSLKNATIEVSRSCYILNKVGQYWNKLNAYPNFVVDTDPDTNSTIPTGVGFIIKLDKNYNTGYDGYIRVYIRMNHKYILIDSYDEKVDI